MHAALLALALAAAPPDAAALAARVQAFYERTRDLEASFVQTYTYAAFGRSQTSRGTLRVKKPGKLRWDYLEPTPKTVLVNGSRLVQYEPEVNQAFIDDAFQASAMSAAVTFLLGTGSLEKEFTLALDPQGRLVLTPRKEDSRVQRVTLTVGHDGEVSASEVLDGSDNVNAIALSRLRRNVGLADDVFKLDLPKDVRRLSMPGK